MRTVPSICAIFLVAGSLLAQQSGASHPLPAGLPPLGPLRSISPPKLKQIRLSNGMEVWLIDRPDLPKVQLTLLLRGGDSLDPASMPGLAQVLAKAVALGTETRSATQIVDAAQFTGGEISASADVDSTQIAIDSLSEYADQALDLLGDMSQNATFPAQEVASTRAHLKNTLLAQQADPHFQARQALFSVFYPQSSYGIVAPTATTVEKLTPESLRAFYRETFAPDRALLIAVGQFEQNTLLKEIGKDFGAWKRSGSEISTPKPPDVRPDHRVLIVDRPHSVQTTMLIAGPAPSLRDSEEPTLELADAIYGSGFSSRLRKNIREDKGYSYHPGSEIETHRWGSTVQTHEDVRNAVTGASLKETFYELDRMATQPPTGQELMHGKRYVIGNIAIAVHSRGGVSDLLGRFWTQDVPAEFLQTQMRAIQASTTGDVQRVATKYLASHRMTVVAVGEKKVIQDQLAIFGMPILDAPPH